MFRISAPLVKTEKARRISRPINLKCKTKRKTFLLVMINFLRHLIDHIIHHSCTQNDQSCEKKKRAKCPVFLFSTKNSRKDPEEWRLFDFIRSAFCSTKGEERCRKGSHNLGHILKRFPICLSLNLHHRCKCRACKYP